MVEKNKKEKKPYILFYKRRLKECHVVNSVTKIKPGEKKKIYKSNTHVLLNGEVDFFLCSKWKITENAYSSQIFFKKKTVQVIVTFTNKTFINHEVERSYSGKLHTLCVTRRLDNQSWINQLSPKNGYPLLLRHSVLHYLSSIFVVINQIKFPRFFHGR